MIEVTDDMVRRAYDAWRNCPEGGEAFRLALEAALNPPPPPPPPRLFSPGSFIITPTWRRVSMLPAIVLPVGDQQGPGDVHVFMPGLGVDILSHAWLVQHEARLATHDEIAAWRRGA